MRLPESILFYRDSVTNSYSQVLFSNQPWLGGLLLVVSFINPYAGISGLLAVVFTIALANVLGLNQEMVRNGAYGYNVLLLGLVMGVYYDFTFAFFFMLALGCFITLMLTVWMAVKLATHKVPFLSLPFLVAVWIVLLSSRNIGAIHLTERGVYELNELWQLGGATLVDAYERIEAFDFPFALDVYLKSLGSIFFQHNLVAGSLIALGLLFYSRIAFSLSLIAFYSGYLFCWITQGNIAQLNNSYVGFNFILTGLAVGFYIVPSFQSYLLTMLLMPVVSVVMGAMDVLVASYQLPIFSLPFSAVVIGLVFLLWNRTEAKGLPLLVNQQYCPEKNLYTFWTDGIRFKNNTYWHIQLPFFGEWRVSQGHKGGITHKGDWSYAWDFDIADDTGKTYRLPGKEPADFYCYGLPVLAPAAGYVTQIINEVEENEIGTVNTVANWGNTIVIKHSDYLYSKLSHLKKDSFKVKVGDYVNQGDKLAVCGNSGRSPEPHIHFQLQSTPHVGSKTLQYPISFFVEKGETPVLRAFDIPAEGKTIFNPERNSTIQNAFKFIPGQRLIFATEGGKTRQEEWEVMVDSYNQTYLYCTVTQSVAYFVNNGVTFYFTQFYGKRESLLYKFYLGAYKILLANYPSIQMKDALSVEGFYSGLTKFLHDFIAPFYRRLNAEYQSTISETGEDAFEIKSTTIATSGSTVKKQVAFTISIDATSITGFTFTENDLCVQVKRY